MEENNTVDWFGQSAARNNGNGHNGHGNGHGYGHGNGNGNGHDDDIEPVPIDGGVVYLFTIAILIITALGIFGIFKKQIQAR